MCYRAAVKILRSYRKRGIVTVKDIIRTWAPPAENNTEAYVKSLLSIMSPRFAEPFVVTADTEIDLRNRELVFHLLYAMTRIETGWNAAAMATVKEKIYTGYDLAVTEPRFF